MSPGLRQHMLFYLGVAGLVLLPCLACVLPWLPHESLEAARLRVPLARRRPP
jgi:hypothetical protein